MRFARVAHFSTSLQSGALISPAIAQIESEIKSKKAQNTLVREGNECMTLLIESLKLLQCLDLLAFDRRSHEFECMHCEHVYQMNAIALRHFINLCDLHFRRNFFYLTTFAEY